MLHLMSFESPLGTVNRYTVKGFAEVDANNGDVIVKFLTSDDIVQKKDFLRNSVQQEECLLSRVQTESTCQLPGEYK